MQCNETTNVILILRARSRSRSLGLNVNDARAEDGLIDVRRMDAFGWMDRSDGDRARRGRLRESVVVVVANARLVRRPKGAEKRVEHPNPKRIIIVNETNRIAFERSLDHRA